MNLQKFMRANGMYDILKSRRKASTTTNNHSEKSDIASKGLWVQWWFLFCDYLPFRCKDFGWGREMKVLVGIQNTGPAKRGFIDLI